MSMQSISFWGESGNLIFFLKISKGKEKQWHPEGIRSLLYASIFISKPSPRPKASEWQLDTWVKNPTIHYYWSELSTAWHWTLQNQNYHGHPPLWVGWITQTNAVLGKNSLRTNMWPITLSPLINFFHNLWQPEHFKFFPSDICIHVSNLE